MIIYYFTKISIFKVPDLKKELKNRGLNTTGNKIDLIERLQNALKSAEIASNNESVDDLDEDLLNVLFWILFIISYSFQYLTF